MIGIGAVTWRGRGLAVMVLALGVGMICKLLAGAILGSIYVNEHKWPDFVSFFISACLCWFVGRHLNSKPGAIIIDRNPHGLEFFNRAHSLFFVPVEYWAFPILFLDLVSLV